MPCVQKKKDVVQKTLHISMISRSGHDRSGEVAMRREYGFGVLCCVLGFLVGICFVGQVEGRIYYRCGNGHDEPTCEDHGGYLCKKDNKVGKKLTDCLKFDGAVWEDRPPFCGDGWIEGIEECDDGQWNSDSLPNACRTDCRRAHCGDEVHDRGEDCDNGRRNSDIVPNACRTSCRFPSCGDGLHDFDYGEACDDGNQDESDGCRSDCRTCTRLTGNVFVNAETFFLCKGDYSVASYPDAGAIIVQNENYGIVVDCAGATLHGSGDGAGIFVRNTSATIRNCVITGYAAGIRAVNSHVVIEASNRLTGNTRGIVLENSTRSDSTKAVTPMVGMPKGAAKGMRPETSPDGGKAESAKIASPPIRARTGLSAAPPSPGARLPLTVAKPVPAVPPSAKVVAEGKRVFLNLNVAVARAEVYAGNRLVGRLPSGNRLEITNHVPKAVRGELILHYFDARGTKTVQAVKIGSDRK